MNGITGRVFLIGMYRKLKNMILLATTDVNLLNKTKNKSQEISFHDHSYDMEEITISVSDETNRGSIVSDSHTGNKQNVEEIKSLNQIRDNGKNASVDNKYFCSFANTLQLQSKSIAYGVINNNNKIEIK